METTARGIRGALCEAPPLTTANSSSGRLISRGDYTQLTSYMGNMESSGVPADKVRGILVAPGFSQKVLNSAAIEPRITLLRFSKVP